MHEAKEYVTEITTPTGTISTIGHTMKQVCNEMATNNNEAAASGPPTSDGVYVVRTNTGRELMVERKGDRIDTIPQCGPIPPDTITAHRPHVPLVPTKPVFQHDCHKCVFLGRCDDCDLYFCDTAMRPLLLCRRSDAPEDCSYTTPGSSACIKTDRFAKALRLAKERGLVKDENTPPAPAVIQQPLAEIIGRHCYLSDFGKLRFKVTGCYLEESTGRSILCLCTVSGGAMHIERANSDPTVTVLGEGVREPHRLWLMAREGDNGKPEYCIEGHRWTPNTALAKRWPEAAVDALGFHPCRGQGKQVYWITEEDAPSANDIHSARWHLTKQDGHGTIYWHKNDTGTWTHDRSWAKAFNYLEKEQIAPTPQGAEWVQIA